MFCSFNRRMCWSERCCMLSTHLLAVVLASLSILASAGVHAADSADCAGVVLDENGVPIAATKITLQSSGGQTFRAETDGAGRFLLRNVPVGDYKVEVRKEGFFVLSGQTVTLSPGPNDIHLTLKHAEELHEQVQVTAAANQIDTQDTTQREDNRRDSGVVRGWHACAAVHFHWTRAPPNFQPAGRCLCTGQLVADEAPRSSGGSANGLGPLHAERHVRAAFVRQCAAFRRRQCQTLTRMGHLQCSAESLRN